MKDAIKVYGNKFWDLYSTQDKPIVLFGNGEGIKMPLEIPEIPKELQSEFVGLSEQDKRSKWVATILQASCEHGYLASYADSLIFHKSGLYQRILLRDKIKK